MKQNQEKWSSQSVQSSLSVGAGLRAQPCWPAETWVLSDSFQCFKVKILVNWTDQLHGTTLNDLSNRLTVFDLTSMTSTRAISYLFKVYVEASWYQQEIRHNRLRHPNERNNLVVPFRSEWRWGLKKEEVVSDEKYFYILQNHDGKLWPEYNKNSSRNLNLLLYANIGYSCNTGCFRARHNPPVEKSESSGLM